MLLIATFLVVLLTIFPSDFCMSFVMFLIALVTSYFFSSLFNTTKDLLGPSQPQNGQNQHPSDDYRIEEGLTTYMILFTSSLNIMYSVFRTFLDILPNMMIIIHDGPHDVPSDFDDTSNCFHTGNSH